MSQEKFTAFAVNGTGGRYIQLRNSKNEIVAGAEKADVLLIRMMSSAVRINRDAIEFLTQEQIDKGTLIPRNIMEPLTMDERDLIQNTLRW